MSVGDIPPGWVIFEGVLQPGLSVAAFAERHQIVRGKCERNDCRRNVTLNPKSLVREGLGRLAMQRVQRTYHCARLDGCTLMFWGDKPDMPLRLRDCMGRANVKVRVRCRGNGCKFRRTFTVEEIAAGLAKRGVGDEKTEIEHLAAKLTAPCPVCKKANWAADIIWIDQTTLGWAQRGDAYLEEVAARVPSVAE